MKTNKTINVGHKKKKFFRKGWGLLVRKRRYKRRLLDIHETKKGKSTFCTWTYVLSKSNINYPDFCWSGINKPFEVKLASFSLQS